jgi:DNA primase
MGLYTADSLERLKQAVDMVELVGARTDLRRSGARWVGLCPFHDERTPSFSVSAERGLYHCFGCGASGDAISFVRQTEALDFAEAVEFLADRYGVELTREQEDPRAEERRRRRERLYALLERAARFYANYLWVSVEAVSARAYLEGRGLRDEVLREFRVGYAPSAWDRVVTGAQRDGYRPEEIVAAGLGQRGRQGGIYDRFRGRITFPLADARGRVLGFGARALRPSQQPKYLNTSENELYHKRRQLFGLDRARAAAARTGRLVVVEGYTDVLALHQVGIPEAVAIMGTALTQEQLAELRRALARRASGQICLALDADRAGLEAMVRSARAAREDGIELLVAELPPGGDPADVALEGGREAISKLVSSAITVPEFQVDRALAEGELETPAGRERILRQVRGVIGGVEPGPLRDRLVGKVADRLDISAHDVIARLATARQVASEVISGAGAGAPSPTSPELRAEREFLTMCLASGELGRRYMSQLSDEHLHFQRARRARDHLLGHFDDPLGALPEDDPALTATVMEIAMAAAEREPEPEPVLRMSFLPFEQRRIDRELREAEELGDRRRQDDLAAARQDLRREMDAVMGQTA